jgi:hypothetical protein
MGAISPIVHGCYRGIARISVVRSCGIRQEFTRTAEVRAERALRVEPRNPWAQHALTHVLIRQGRVQEGRARMEAFMPLLMTCGRPIHSHDAWHLALLYLEELDVAATMRVFRDHIWELPRTSWSNNSTP